MEMDQIIKKKEEEEEEDKEAAAVTVNMATSGKSKGTGSWCVL